MSPWLVIAFIVGYFLLLMAVSWFTGKETSNDAFFLGNKRSPWYVVAFGMIGASLSGVTFISVPGWVASSQFSYMQMVLGYLAGYAVIATILMPLYYRLNLTSIYTYLEQRFGFWSYKTGAFYFLLSRTIGAAFRLYLVAMVFNLAVFEKLEMFEEANEHFVFAISVVVTILLIWLYTFRAGIKTIVWTDTLQTLFMLTAVGVTIILIAQQMNLGPTDVIEKIQSSDYSKIFYFDDWNSDLHFAKRFIAGMFIAIAMTGLDQDMMQKNLSCKSIGDAQKNMFWFSIVLVFANLLFLALGALLYIYSEFEGIAIPEKADQLYPIIALDGYLGPAVGIFFVLGLIAAAYSSADSALTALTTSFCVDFLDIKNRPEQDRIWMRKYTHIGFSILLILVIMLFRVIDDDSVISKIFTVASYTYGPLLGLYAFGLFTKIKIHDHYVWLVCLFAPIACWVLATWSEDWFNGFKFSYELLIINGIITFLGLLAIAKKKS